MGDMVTENVCLNCNWEIESIEEAFGVNDGENDGYVCDSTCLAEMIDKHGLVALKGV